MFNVQRIMLEANCTLKVKGTISGDISALMLYRASEEEEGLKICIHPRYLPRIPYLGVQTASCVQSSITLSSLLPTCYRLQETCP